MKTDVPTKDSEHINIVVYNDWKSKSSDRLMSMLTGMSAISPSFILRSRSLDFSQAPFSVGSNWHRGFPQSSLPKASRGKSPKYQHFAETDD